MNKLSIYRCDIFHQLSMRLYLPSRFKLSKTEISFFSRSQIVID